MGIYIPNMEMPKTCQSCRTAKFDRIVGCEEWDRLSIAQRMYMRSETCPLVPLPAGHGRLIDADALAEDLDFDVENDQRALDDLNIVGIERERIQFDKDCKQNCMWYLTKCQTIVPAEGGAENG